MSPKIQCLIVFGQEVANLLAGVVVTHVFLRILDLCTDYGSRLQTTPTTRGGTVQIVSTPPGNAEQIYRFFVIPALRTRWMADTAPHKSG